MGADSVGRGLHGTPHAIALAHIRGDALQPPRSQVPIHFSIPFPFQTLICRQLALEFPILAVAPDTGKPGRQAIYMTAAILLSGRSVADAHHPTAETPSRVGQSAGEMAA